MAEPKIVTRFINSNVMIDRNGRVTSKAYNTVDNRRNKEISVYNIDNELKNNNEKGIYAHSKNMRNKPFARADLSVSDIKKISEPVQLYLEKSKRLFDKHCNIKPFPDEWQHAEIVASSLALISKLHYK